MKHNVVLTVASLLSIVFMTFHLTSATPYPSGVVGLHYTRQRGTM